MLLAKVLFLITLINFYVCVAKCYDEFFEKDYTIEKVQFINESAIAPVQCKFKIKRIDRIHHLFADFNLTDYPRNYDIEIKIYYSALGNSQYILMPYGISRKPFCDVINTMYRERLMHYIKNVSNFPFTNDPEVDICDMFSLGSYHVTDLKCVLDGKFASVPEGYYKSETMLYKKNQSEIVFDLVVIGRVFL